MKNQKKAQSKVIVTMLLILLVLTLIVVLWRVIDEAIEKGAGEVPTKTGCLTFDLEIIRVNNGSSNNLFLKKDGGVGGLVGIRVYWSNKSSREQRFLEDIEIEGIDDVDKNTLIVLNITHEDINENATAPGMYLKIGKLVGKYVETAELCGFDGKSAQHGVKIATNSTG